MITFLISILILGYFVFGSIFTGAVHDYFSGMLSIRHGGDSIPEIVEKYLGTGIKYFMRIFSVVLLILVGVVFLKGPAAFIFMTAVVITYILVAPEGFKLDYSLSCGIGFFASTCLTIWFLIYKSNIDIR